MALSRFSILLLIPAIFLSCHKHTPAPARRAYRMGFQSSAPRPDITLYLQSLSVWTARSDAAIISVQVPWDSLLAGEDPIAYAAYDYQTLVTYCRSKQFALWVYIDPENGLDRSVDADDLAAHGLSIAQPPVQQRYQRFVVVMDSILHPDHLGLALETNLIRFIAPDSIYQGVKNAAAGAAAAVRVFDPTVALSVSVQVEVAWGKLGNTGYTGIAQDLRDFPFMQEVGLSSYPYIVYNTPADLPDDYYSRLTTLPLFVSEGGWTSAPVTANNQTIQGTPAIQAAYITRQGQLLSSAHGIGWFQLTFTDLSLGAWPPADQAGLEPFAYLGLVDTTLTPKPALQAWDTLFAQTRTD